MSSAPFRTRFRAAATASLFLLPFSILSSGAVQAGTAAVTAADVEGPFTWGGVANVTRLGTLWLAGQPDAAALERARSEGVTTVIDLRAPDETEWDERAAAEGAGLAYFNVPLSGQRFDPEAMATIDALVAAGGKEEVLVHCSSSNRAGGWLAAHLATRRGVALDEALEIGRAAGITKPAVEQTVRSYVEGQAASERAREALAPLKARLPQLLMAAMQEQGPIGAVAVCRLAAPAATRAAMRPGVVIGRTSHRLRNPENAPAQWMRPVLDDYASGEPQPGTSRVVALDAGRFGYAEPIYMAGPCLTCHGSSVAPGLLAHIRELYPEDRAIGFAEGDFRGLFWAEVDAD